MPFIVDIPGQTAQGAYQLNAALGAQGAEIVRVTTAPGGAPILDFADGVAYSYVPDSLLIDTSGQASGAGLPLVQSQAAMSQSEERYGGAVVDYDQRANAILQWRAVLLGVTAGSVDKLAATIAAEVERNDPPMQRFVEWRRVGASNSLWYERRGPGIWAWVERWESAEIALIDVQIPVAPVAYGPPVVQSLGSAAVPATWALTAPGGSLPALMDVQVQTAAALKFGLLAGCAGAWGPVEAESGTLVGFTNTADAGTARGGHKAALSGSAPHTIAFTFDPSTAFVDSNQYERDVAIEIIVRAQGDPTLVVQAKLSATTPDGTITVYPLDYGQGGKQLLLPSTNQWGLYRLGTLRIPPNPGAWTITAEFDVISGTATFAADYLLAAPARQRACGPTGVANDATYPPFTPISGTYTKKIKSDLSALGISGAATPTHFDRGLAGSPLRCPPSGSPILLIMASAAVPDDQNATGAADVLGPTVTPTVTLTPRYLLGDSR